MYHCDLLTYCSGSQPSGAHGPLKQKVIGDHKHAPLHAKNMFSFVTIRDLLDL